MSRSHIGRTLRNARFCSRMPRMDAVSDGSVALPDRADITVSQCHNAALSQTHTHTPQTHATDGNKMVPLSHLSTWPGVALRFDFTQPIKRVSSLASHKPSTNNMRCVFRADASVNSVF